MTEALKRTFESELGGLSGSKRYRHLYNIARTLELPVTQARVHSRKVGIVTHDALVRLNQLSDEDWSETYKIYTNSLADPTIRVSLIGLADIRLKISAYIDSVNSE